MSRNGPVGQPGTRAPVRRSAADLDQYPSGQSAWPPPEGADPLQQGYAPHAPLGAPQQHSQGGYYFPQPVEPDAIPATPSSLSARPCRSIACNRHLGSRRRRSGMASTSAMPAIMILAAICRRAAIRGAMHSPRLRRSSHRTVRSGITTAVPVKTATPTPTASTRRWAMKRRSPGGAARAGDCRGPDRCHRPWWRHGLHLQDVNCHPDTRPRGQGHRCGTEQGEAVAVRRQRVCPHRQKVAQSARRGGWRAARRRRRSRQRGSQRPASRAQHSDFAGGPAARHRWVGSCWRHRAWNHLGQHGAFRTCARAVARPTAATGNVGEGRGADPSCPGQGCCRAAFGCSRGCLRGSPACAPQSRGGRCCAHSGTCAEGAAAAVVTASTSGYVAVLSSQKSRMDALKAFADLQQKYGDVLSSKTPDVQEANLGDKGVWFRAVVGPPVSRDAASGICSQLKAAGYAGCWVTAY